ncbi:MAG: hypothetical protein ACP5G4_08270, partial [bacterium]
EHPFYVYTDMTDWLRGVQDYTLGDSHLGIWGTDYSYTWSDYDSEGVFGVDILNDKVLAVGFEHGFSILNYSDLDSIHEVAYYRDTDSIYCFTHFALKDDRMYAMAHPGGDTCRLYMFELDESVISGIEEEFPPQTALPMAFEISAWPNPFNSSVTIAIDGVGDGFPVPFDVEIYDVGGRMVADAEPADKPHAVEAGADRLTNDTSTSSVSVFAPLTKGGQGGFYIWRPHESLPSGVYLVRATIPGNKELQPLVSTKRIVYLK